MWVQVRGRINSKRHFTCYMFSFKKPVKCSDLGASYILPVLTKIYGTVSYVTTYASEEGVIHEMKIVPRGKLLTGLTSLAIFILQ